MTRFLVEWTGRNGRKYLGFVDAVDWETAEQQCCEGMEVLGEHVGTVDAGAEVCRISMGTGTLQ